MIRWRNKEIHSLSENELRQALSEIVTLQVTGADGQSEMAISFGLGLALGVASAALVCFAMLA